MAHVSLAATDGPPRRSDEDTVTAPRYAIRSVDRALDILDLLRGADSGLPLREIARAIGLPRSSVFRYLATLEARGHVARTDAESFRIGEASKLVRPRDLALLIKVARPRLRELCRQFEETINLGVLDATRVAYLDVVESPQAMRFAAQPGSCDNIHSTALGKVLAARMTRSEAGRILSIEGMAARTPHTFTDSDTFLDALDRVRARGYAVDDRENEMAGRCVAVALPGPLAAAISVSAPATRLPLERVDSVAVTLRRAADEIASEMLRVGT